MAAVTFTQTEIDAYRSFMLNNKGLTLMKIGDREYRFAPLAEMREQLSYMQRNINTGSTGRVRYVESCKGV